MSFKARKALCEQLKFCEATFGKFCKIGADPRFQNQELVDQLPPNWTIYYQVSQLSSEHFEQALRQGVFHPDMQREDLVRFAAIQGSRWQTTSLPRVPSDYFAAICLPSGFSAEQEDDLSDELEAMSKKYGLTIVRSADQLMAKHIGKLRLAVLEAAREEKVARKAMANGIDSRAK